MQVRDARLQVRDARMRQEQELANEETRSTGHVSSFERAEKSSFQLVTACADRKVRLQRERERERERERDD